MDMRKRLLFLFIIVCMVPFCAKEPVLTFPAHNIILISLDTTRADHLSCYGYSYKTSPHIDAIAADSVMFKNTISQAPLTFPSHSSVFTGILPGRLGIKDNGGYYLNKSFTTLAEVVQNNMYATAGIIGAFVLHSKWGISQGFQFYDDKVEYETYKAFSLISIERPANVVTMNAIKWLKERPHDKSFFLFVHFFDPHSPYSPHPEIKAQYPLLYDGEIAFMDQHIGVLMEFLKENNLYDSSLIVVFGDHGEGLGEHGEQAHGMFLYDATLKVPLIMKLPGGINKGSRITRQVRLIDVMPTVLDLVNLKLHDRIDGVSLKSLVAHPEMQEPDESITRQIGFAYSETYYPFLHYGWSPLYSVRTDRYKFIQAPKVELYDIHNDSRELTNRAHQESEKTTFYSSKMSSYLQSHVENFAEPERLSTEDQEKLIALGYAGFFSSISSGSPLADPKDKIDIVKALESAKVYSHNKDIQSALKEINYVIQKDKTISEAWFLAGNLYARSQDYVAAVSAFKTVVDINPQNAFALFNLAHAYQNQGNWDEAINWYKKTIEVDKSHFKALVSLGELLFFKKNYNESLFYLNEALKFKPDTAGIYSYLAGIYFYKGNMKLAHQYADQAYSLNPNLPFLNFHLGLMYEKENLINKAIEAYQKELELNPENASAINNLGVLYARTQRYEDANLIFRKLIQVRPDNWRPYFLLAKVLEKQKGDPDEIIRLLTKAQHLKQLSP